MFRMIPVGETHNNERRRRNVLNIAVQEGKLSGKSTAGRRDSGELLRREHQRGSRFGKSLRLKDRGNATRYYSVFLFISSCFLQF